MVETQYVFDVRMLVAVDAFDLDDAVDKLGDALGVGEVCYGVECLTIQVNDKNA